jgi:hypothetical protein
VTRTWTTEELHEIGAAAELSVAPLRPDGSLRPYTTIWVVRVGDHLHVRSYRGPSGSWYQAVISTGTGRIRAGGIERGVTFDQAPAVEPVRDRRRPPNQVRPIALCRCHRHAGRGVHGPAADPLRP